MSAFAPAPALLGGVAIGLSIAAHALVFGRVTGVSGHLNRALRRERPSDALLLAGLALGGLLLAAPSAGSSSSSAALPLLPARLAVAGALVAVGASLAAGCTSGHAVCGVSRLSPRSMIAAPVFVGVAIATSRAADTVQVLLRAAAAAAAADTAPGEPALVTAGNPADLIAPYGAVLALQVACLAAMRRNPAGVLRSYATAALQVLIGMGFSMGLICSGMSVPLKVASFFDVGRPTWDPSLLLVFPGALLLSSLAFHAVQTEQSPFLEGAKHSLPSKTPLTLKLVAGAVTFGCGWGLAGICPGPAVVLLGSSLKSLDLLPSVLTWFGGYAVGLAGISSLSSYL
jgi:uncharacterized protein